MPMSSKQNILTQVRKVLRWKVEQSSHNWHGISECCCDKLLMFVIGKARKPCCFKNVKFYLVGIDIKRRAGWMGSCSKSGYEN